MRNVITVAAALVMILAFVSTDAMAVELFGSKAGGSEGMFSYFFQWMRDDDGDGIPNGLDPDWTKPSDGTGYGKTKGDGSCSDDCDGTPDRIQSRTKKRTNDCPECGCCVRLTR